MPGKKSAEMPARHKGGQKVILYDGLCTMCKGIAGTIDKSSQNKRFKTTDMHTAELPGDLSQAQIEKEIHVIDRDGTIYKNADAVLKIIEEYPRWSWLARVGRLPGVHWLLTIAYAFVAANRHFIAGPAWRLYWTKNILALGLLWGVLLSWNTWLSGREFPLAPVLSGVKISAPLDVFIPVGITVAALAILLRPKPRLVIFAAIAFLAVAVFLDQMRLQPWVFQYAAMLLAVGMFSWRKQDSIGGEKIQQALNICRLIIAATYIWSGIHKFNASFIYSAFPWMIEPVTRHLPDSLHDWTYIPGIAVPIVELGIGLALLIPKVRGYAVVAAVGMHLSILAVLGPVGQQWNAVIWPWNVAMILLVIVLFWKTPQVSARRIIWNRQRPYHLGVAILFGLLPVLSLSGNWDKYLSAALYSDDIPHATLTVETQDRHILPEAAFKASSQTDSGNTTVIVTNWAVNALGVPPYPEPRVFNTVGRQLCDAGAASLTMQVRWNQTPWQPAFTERYQCENL